MKLTALFLIFALRLVSVAPMAESVTSWCAAEAFSQKYVDGQVLSGDFKIDPSNKLDSKKTKQIAQAAGSKGFNLAVIARSDFTERANPDARRETLEVETWLALLAQSTHVKGTDTFALILESRNKFDVYLYNARGKLPGTNPFFLWVAKDITYLDEALNKIVPALDTTILHRGMALGFVTWGLTKLVASALVTNLVFAIGYLGWFKSFKWENMGRPEKVRLIQGLRDVATLTIGKRAGEEVMRALA